MAAGDAAAQRSALPDEVVLPHELLERARTHASGERLALRWGLEQGFGSCAPGTSSGRHGAMVAPRRYRRLPVRA